MSGPLAAACLRTALRDLRAKGAGPGPALPRLCPLPHRDLVLITGRGTVLAPALAAAALAEGAGSLRDAGTGRVAVPAAALAAMLRRFEEAPLGAGRPAEPTRLLREGGGRGLGALERSAGSASASLRRLQHMQALRSKLMGHVFDPLGQGKRVS